MKWLLQLTRKGLGGWLWSAASIILVLTPIVYTRGIERIWYSDLAAGPDTVALESVRLVDIQTGLALPEERSEAGKWHRRGYRLIRPSALQEGGTSFEERTAIPDTSELMVERSFVTEVPVLAMEAPQGTELPAGALATGTLRIREKQIWVRGTPVLALPYLGAILLRQGQDDQEKPDRQGLCMCPP